MLIALIIWVSTKPRQKSDKVQTFLNEEELKQRQYNAKQYTDRSKKIIADAAAKPVQRVTRVSPPKSVPKTTGLSKPASIKRPDSTPWPFPTATPAPTPAPSSGGDVLIGLAAGAFIDAMMHDHDEGRSCSNNTPSTPFESGGGGDFGGGGADSSWSSSND